MNALSVGLDVRLTGGKYNGLEGRIAKLCDQYASVIINYENKTYELVEAVQFITPMHEWLKGKSKSELQLRGHNQ